MPRLALVGPGRAGRSLAGAARRAGIAVDLAGREDALSACRGAEVALLCVPDAEIEAACETIAAAVPPLRLVGHTSGATGLDALEPVRRRGADVFSLHPLQTLPDGDADLSGAACAISASSPAGVELARSLASATGMRPFELPEERRAAYHAAAAMASNFLIALEESAAELLGRAGVDEARAALAPLVLRTAANWAERGGAALTGPIARGDEATVSRHVEALEALAPELLGLYEELARRTRDVAAPAAEARS